MASQHPYRLRPFSVTFLAYALIVFTTVATGSDVDDAESPVASAVKLAKEWEQYAHSVEENWKAAEAAKTKLSESLSQAAAETETLKARLASLEEQLKDGEALAQANKQVTVTQEKEAQARIAMLQGELDGANKRVAAAETLKEKKEEKLKQALKDVIKLTAQLESTEKKLEEKTRILDSLSEHLPPPAGQGSAKSEGEAGLLERMKLAATHQETLGKEVETLRKDLAATEHKFKETFKQNRQLSSSKADLEHLQAQMALLEKEAAERKAALDEVAAMWLPPWAAEALESTQTRVQYHWKEHALPSLRRMHSESLGALQYTRQQAEPHVRTLMKSSSELLQDTRERLQPHLEVAVQRHSEAVQWLKSKSQEAYVAAVPHVETTRKEAQKVLAQAQEAAAPYVRQVYDAVRPYYDEAYAAAKPSLDAVQSGAVLYWRSASRALGPQLEQLKKVSAAYQEQVLVVVGNVTQQVQAALPPPADLAHYAEMSAYTLLLLLPVLVVVYVLRHALLTFVFGGKLEQKGSKGKVGAHQNKKQHHHHHVKKQHHSHNKH